MEWQIEPPAGGSANDSAALYFGDLDHRDHDVDHAAAAARSPVVVLPVAAAVELTPRLYLAIDTCPNCDRAALRLYHPRGAADLWSSTTDRIPGWRSLRLDLTQYAGEEVLLQLHAGNDDRGNAGEGIYVDDLRVRATCS